jgi:hypothetical protein
LWHAHGVRRVLLFTLTLACSGLIPAQAAPSSSETTQLLRTFNSDPSEQKRIAALAQLEKTAPLDAQQVSRSISDTSATIRAAMVRIGTPMVGTDHELELRLLALSNDHSPIVQKQLLNSLPSFPSPKAKEALQKVQAALAKSSDPKPRKAATTP